MFFLGFVLFIFFKKKRVLLMLHDFYDMKQTNKHRRSDVSTRVAVDEALNEATATNRFNAATSESNVQHMPTWRRGEGGGRDTSNLFLTRHNDVNAWAFKNKRVNHVIGNKKCNINTNIHHTEIHLRKKMKLKKKV